MAKDWYILYVNAGREIKTLKEIQRQISQSEYKEYIGDVKVPIEDVFELYRGKKRKVSKTFLAGYVLIELDLDLEKRDWMILCQFLNRINGVKKLVGYEPNHKPIPISKEEVKYIFERMGEIKTTISNESRFPFLEGDTVRVIDGPFANFTGVIEKINYEKLKIKVAVQIFGRSTPVDLDFNQISILS